MHCDTGRGPGAFGLHAGRARISGAWRGEWTFSVVWIDWWGEEEGEAEEKRRAEIFLFFFSQTSILSRLLRDSTARLHFTSTPSLLDSMDDGLDRLIQCSGYKEMHGLWAIHWMI